MPEKNPKLQARMTQEQLDNLDEAIKVLGYTDRTHWIKEMYKQAVSKAEKKRKEATKND